MLDMIFSADTNAIMWIQENMRNPFLSSILIPLTKSGDAGVLLIIIGILLICFKKTRKAGIIFLVALVLNFVINNLLIKNLVARARPFQSIDALMPLIDYPGGYSFPSGHTSSVFACMVTFCFTQKKIVPLALMYAVLMGFSRVYVGVHYPTDVICGALIGTVIACVCAYGYKCWESKRKMLIE